MSTAAKVIYVLFGFTGNVALGQAIEPLGWALLGMLLWSFMLLVIVQGVDESIRN